VKVGRASGGEGGLSLEENQGCAAKPAILVGFRGEIEQSVCQIILKQ
jgi:hypothetical protein